MKKTLSLLLSAVFVAFLVVGCEDEEVPKTNYYELDGVEFTIDSTMFWYSAGMGGDSYIRLLTAVNDSTVDLIKILPNIGLEELPGIYTWAAGNGIMDPIPSEVGQYDIGYTGGYVGRTYDWVASGDTGSGELTIEETSTGLYHITGEMVLATGDYDFMGGTGAFIPDGGTKSLKLDYTGAITPL